MLRVFGLLEFKRARRGAVHLAGLIRRAAQLLDELLLLDQLLLADLRHLGLLFGFVGLLFGLRLRILHGSHHSAQKRAPSAVVQTLVAPVDLAHHARPLPVGVIVHGVPGRRAELPAGRTKAGDERPGRSLQARLIRLLRPVLTRPRLRGLDVVAEEVALVRPEQRVHVVEELEHLRTVFLRLGRVVGV